MTNSTACEPPARVAGGVSEIEYGEARRVIDDRRETARKAQDKVKRFESAVAQKVALHDPLNGATAYSLKQRDQDSETLSKLRAEHVKACRLRDTVHATISNFERCAAQRQFAAALQKLSEICAQAAPHGARAVQALRTLVTEIESLTTQYAAFQRIVDGDLRSAGRELEGLGMPLPESLPNFGVTARALLDFLSAKFRLNPNARAVAGELSELFPHLAAGPTDFEIEEDWGE
jgi:hypothetical protein